MGYSVSVSKSCIKQHTRDRASFSAYNIGWSWYFGELGNELSPTYRKIMEVSRRLKEIEEKKKKKNS